MGYLDMSPGVGMRHLEGPKNPDGLNLGTYVFVYVYKVHMKQQVLSVCTESTWENITKYVTIITDVHILNYAVSLETCRITTNT